MAQTGNAVFMLKKPITLVGMMGSGKTAIGRALAERLGVDFQDSDAEIVTAAGMPISDIFDRDGEAFFRAREAEVIERLLTTGTCILSTGGGAYLQNKTRGLIERHSVSLWLEADLDILWERVRQKDTRPLLRTQNPYETLKSLLEERVASYKTAQLSVSAEAELSIEEMTTKTVEVLLQSGYLIQKDIS